MTTMEKCEAIIKKIVEIVNTGEAVEFTEDFGGNSLTIEITDRGHTHCGYPDADWEVLVDNLYNSLHGGPGLSFA